MHDLSDRHPSVQGAARWFEHDHQPSDLRIVSGECHDLAAFMIRHLPDDPQLTVGLQHLLAAKDAFVRAAVVKREQDAAGVAAAAQPVQEPPC